MRDIKTIGVLCYHRCSESDAIVPWELMTGVKVYKNMLGQPAPEVLLVALKEGPIEMQMGAMVQPHKVLADDDLFDLLYVPGGNGSGDAIADPRVMDVIRRHKQAGKFIAANCVGVGIIHRAGVIGDTYVTCSPPVERRLREEGTNVISPRTMWLGAPDDNLWTTAGSSAINAGTVAMIHYLFGDEVGREMSMWFDTRGALGYKLFTLEGREYYHYPEAEAALQDATADVLLPPLQ